MILKRFRCAAFHQFQEDLGEGVVDGGVDAESGSDARDRAVQPSNLGATLSDIEGEGRRFAAAPSGDHALQDGP